MKMNLQNTKKRATKSQSYMLALGLLAVSTTSIPAFASNSSLTSPLTSAENVVALSNNSKAATSSTDPTETRHESRRQYRSNYWFVGAEVMSPPHLWNALLLDQRRQSSLGAWCTTQRWIPIYLGIWFASCLWRRTQPCLLQQLPTQFLSWSARRLHLLSLHHD